MQNNNILVAKITSVHGIKGELRAVIYADKADDIEQYSLIDEKDNSFQIVVNKNSIKAGKKTKSGDHIIIIKIKDIDDRDQAQKIVGTNLYANREDFKKLDNDEFYIEDLVGLDVICENDKIATVENVLNFGAGVMLEIKFDKDKVPKNYQQIESLPFKNEFFPNLDIKNGTIEATLPEYDDEK